MWKKRSPGARPKISRKKAATLSREELVHDRTALIDDTRTPFNASLNSRDVHSDHPMERLRDRAKRIAFITILLKQEQDRG